MPNPKIRNLSIYPVKSCDGIEVPRATLTQSGLSVNGYRDHQYMVVRAKPNDRTVYEFLTQKDADQMRKEGSDRIALMALIKPEIKSGILRLTWRYEQPIEVPEDTRGTELTVKIWDDETSAVDKGREVSEWLSDHLGLKVRLVEATGSFSRTAEQTYTENQNPLRFQDIYPVHWFSAESLQELYEKSGQQIPWQAFRPQIVTEGSEPRFEHDVEFARIAGLVSFRNIRPCDRCLVTQVDPETGIIRTDEPLRTLAKYKNWIKNTGKRKVIFGEYALPEGIGRIAVGDEVVVNSFRTPPLEYGTLEEIQAA